MTTSAGAVTMSPSATSRERRPALDVRGTGNRIACHKYRSRLHAFFVSSRRLASVRHPVYKRGISRGAGGTMSPVIRRAALGLAVVLLAAATAVPARAQASDPWMGMWVLDRAKSTFSGNVPERRSMTFEKVAN